MAKLRNVRAAGIGGSRAAKRVSTTPSARPHSSTSISAALGMAVAAVVVAKTGRVVAIIGDGAMTAGMAFEALNNAGAMDANLLVILNDNDMSISENVGALNRLPWRGSCPGRVLHRKHARPARRCCEPCRRSWIFARRAEEHVEGDGHPGTLFEEFGFNYIARSTGTIWMCWCPR